MSGAPIEDLKIERALIRRTDRPLTGAMQAFLAILREEIESFKQALAAGARSQRARRPAKATRDPAGQRGRRAGHAAR